MLIDFENPHEKREKEYDYDLLLICPPYLVQEPPLSFFRDESFKFQIINPGILSIASYLESKGFSIKILDMSVDNDFEKIEKELRNNTPRVIGISNNTGFDYLESLKCLEIIKKNSPRSLTIMGGEHCTYVGPLIFKETSNLDILVHGEGELVVEKILTQERKNFSEIQGITFRKDSGELHIATELSDRLPELPRLNYFLYPNITQFTPYIEESRGCPKKCNFCLNYSLYDCSVRYKPLEILSEELEQIVKLWGTKEMLALLTSNFGINPIKTLEQIKIIKEQNITWSTQTAIDSGWETYLPAAYDAGLRVLTVGFESGSKEILKRMLKTTNPEYYIERAEKLIRTAARFPDLTIKLNFVFYLGENSSTLKETLNFLMKNEKYVDTIIYTPLFITPGSELHKNFKKYSELYGAELIGDEYWTKRHLSPCNPSKDFKYEKVVHYCRMIESIFSDKERTLKAEEHHYLIDNKENSVS